MRARLQFGQKGAKMRNVGKEEHGFLHKGSAHVLVLLEKFAGLDLSVAGDTVEEFTLTIRSDEEGVI